MALLIDVGNAYSRVRVCTDAERRWLTGYLSFADESFMGRGDRVKMYDSLTRKFASGFLHLVQKAAAEERVQFDVVDARQPIAPRGLAHPLTTCQLCGGLKVTILHNGGTGPCPSCRDPATKPTGLWLRPNDQLPAAEAALKHKRGLIWASTGFGKSEIAAAIFASVPCEWLFVVHRGGLAQDVAARLLQRVGEQAGIVAEGVWEERRVTCATFQTLHAALANPLHPRHAQALRLVGRVGGFVADEAHTLAAASYGMVAMAMGSASYRLGLSATPLARSDQRSIMVVATTGPVLYRARTEKLIAAGVLAKPRIRMVPCDQVSAKKTHQGVYGELIVRSRTRNEILALMALAAEKPCLLFVKEVAHGKALVERLRRAGLAAEFAWGNLSIDARRGLVKQLVRGELEVVVCSVVFQEGIDVPDLRSVIVGGAGQSAIAALQRIGRGMRAAPGKNGFEVWDVQDTGHPWMTKHAKARFKTYAAEAHEVTAEDEQGLRLRAAARFGMDSKQANVDQAVRAVLRLGASKLP